MHGADGGNVLTFLDVLYVKLSSVLSNKPGANKIKQGYFFEPGPSKDFICAGLK